MTILTLLLIASNSFAGQIGVGAIRIGGVATIANLSIGSGKLAANSVDSDKIVDSAVSTTKINTDAVTGVKILDLVVSTNKLAGDAVTSAKVLDAAISTNKIAADSVTGAKVLNAAISTAKLEIDSVDASKILNAAVTSAKIGTSAVETGKINADAVGTTSLLNLGVTTGKLANLAVETGKLGTDAVTSGKILNGTIATVDIAVGAVDTEALGVDAVTSAEILNGSIQTAKLATDAVTSANIITGAVDTRALADDAVDTGAIRTDSVTSTKIMNASVATNKLATDSVTGSKLMNDASSLAKVSGQNMFASGSNIGIGISAPSTLLHLSNGTLTIDGTTGNAIVAGDGTVSLKRIKLDVATSGDALYGWYQAGTRKWEAYVPASQTELRFTDTSVDRVTFEQGGEVGIGTVDPTSLLHLSTGILTIDGNASGLVISSGATTGSVVLGIIDTTKSIDWGATAAQTCDTSTIGTPSITPGRDRCSIGADADVEGTTCLLRAYVSAADTVTIKRCNVGSGACADPAGTTHRVTCIRQ